MPVGEVIGEGLGVVLRLVGRLLLEVLVEWLIMGAGRTLMGLVRPRSEPSDMACGIVGILFWVVVGGALFALHRAGMA